MTGFHLIYTPGSDAALRFPSIRYPWRREVDRETAEHMLAAMPDPGRFVIVEEGK